MAIYTIAASGDQTGTTDLSNIVESLQANRYAYLEKGDYYVNDSIPVIDGCVINGVNNYLTNIHAVSDKPIIAQNAETSSTGLKIEDLRLISDVESSGYAIDIKGSISSPYTGCSFSVFRNIVIKGFESGFFANHFWNTSLDNIRVMDGTTNGIYIAGGCNNIAVNMFSANTLQNGIRITTSSIDTTENVNISIHNADVEYCNRGIYAYGANNVAIKDIYSEHNSITVYGRECKGFSVDGFYSKIDTKWSELYNDAAIYNGYIQFNSDADVGVIDIQNTDAIIIVKNINAYNSSTGKVYFYRQNIRNENPIGSTLPMYTIETQPFRLRYSSDSYSGVFRSYKNDKDKQFVCATPELVVTQDRTWSALSGDAIYLTKNGTQIAIVDFATGAELNKGDVHAFRRLVNDSKLYTYEDGDTFEITHTSSMGVDVYFALRFSNAHMGKFYT